MLSRYGNSRRLRERLDIGALGEAWFLRLKGSLVREVDVALWGVRCRVSCPGDTQLAWPDGEKAVWFAGPVA